MAGLYRRSSGGTSAASVIQEMIEKEERMSIVNGKSWKVMWLSHNVDTEEEQLERMSQLERRSTIEIPHELYMGESENEKLILETAEHNMVALQYASAAMKADRGFVQKVLKVNPYCLCHAAPELLADKEVVLAAVRLAGAALKFAAPSLRADPEVVLAAVENNAGAVRHAAPVLLRDTDFWAKAVKVNALALKYAGQEIRNNRTFCMSAISTTKNFAVMKHVGSKLAKDLDFQVQAVQETGEPGRALQLVHPSVRSRKSIVLSALARDEGALPHAGPELALPLRKQIEESGRGAQDFARYVCTRTPRTLAAMGRRVVAGPEDLEFCGDPERIYPLAQRLFPRWAAAGGDGLSAPLRREHLAELRLLAEAAARAFDAPPKRKAQDLTPLVAKDISAPHRNIGAVFRSGPHKGQPVYALARGLLRGETTAEQLPPLVVGKLAGDYWVLFGYRRLYALHLAVPHASVEVILHDLDAKNAPRPLLASLLLARLTAADPPLRKAAFAGEPRPGGVGRGRDADFCSAILWRKGRMVRVP